jgi:hypothetical protein
VNGESVEKLRTQRALRVIGYWLFGEIGDAEHQMPNIELVSFRVYWRYSRANRIFD